MEFLRNAIGTRYVTDGHRRRLIEILAENPEETFDVAGCIISKSIAKILEENPLRFIDSADANRGLLLAENRFILQSNIELHDLPVLSGGENALLELLKSLKTNLYYKIPADDFSLAALILLVRPEIKIVPLTHTGRFGHYLRRHLYKRRSYDIDRATVEHLYHKYPTFNVYAAKAVDKIDKKDFTPSDMYHSQYAIIPAAYGVEKLNKDIDWAEFKHLVTQELIVSHKPALTVRSFLEKGK